MAQQQVHLTALAASTLVSVGSLCNGLGRIFWASLSDKLGRKATFLTMLGTQIPAFLLLPHVSSPLAFGALCCYILLCYGGGFSTMPAFAADTFGPQYIGSIYGPMLLAWGAAGVVGPMLMEAVNKRSGNFAAALPVAAALLAVGFVLAANYRKPVLIETS